MKKSVFILVAVIVGLFSSFAVEHSKPTDNGVSSILLASSSVRVIYEVKAYSAAQDGLIPSADGSVSVYWTSDDCSVNGNSGYTPYKINGGTFSMKVNGKYKEMTHYVSYGGERYFFQL